MPEKGQNQGLPLKKACVCFILMHQKSSNLSIEAAVKHEQGKVLEFIVEETETGRHGKAQSKGHRSTVLMLG